MSLLEVGHAWIRASVKKVGQAHFSTRIGDRKAEVSIARSAAGRLAFARKRSDFGPGSPRRSRPWRRSGPRSRPRRRSGLRRCRSLSKPISGSETSLRTIRSAPLRSQLGAGALDGLAPVLGGEADDRLALAPARRRAPARMSSVGSSWSSSAVRALAACPVGGRGGAEVGGRGGHQQDVGGRELRGGGGGELLGGLDVDAAHAGAARAGRRWRRSGSPPPRGAPRRAARAMPMRPLERLPMKRTGSIGSRVPPAVTSTRRPSQGRSPVGSAASTRASRRSGSGRRPRPNSPREASLPSSGSITSTPALAQRRQVRLGRRVGVHAVVHRRGDQARRRAGEEGGGQHRVGDAGGQLGDRVGRGGGDQEGVAVGGQLEVADRVVAGLAVAGEGAAHRVALELGDRGPGRRRSPRRRRRRRSGSPSRSSARARRGRRASPGGPAPAPCRRLSHR